MKAGRPLDAREWAALVYLFERPWFQRTWVVQEIILSREPTFMCGRCELSSAILDIVARGLGRLPLRDGFASLLPYFANKTNKMFSLLKMRGMWAAKKTTGVEPNHLSLPLLTYLFWNSQASDSKDKIFALLGLDEEIALQMEPDYGDTLQTVYTKATHSILSNKRSKDILCLAGIGQERNLPDLPSWVPDFTTARAATLPFGLEPYAHYSEFNAGDIDERGFRFACDGEILAIEGVKIDTVTSKSFVLSYEMTDKILEWLDETWAIFSSSKYLETSGFDARWRSLIGNRFARDGVVGTAPEEYGEYFKMFEAIREKKGTKIDKFDKRHIRDFLHAHWQSAVGKPYCGTANGDVGLMPRYTAIGDIICVFPGVSVPFVIRPNPRTLGGAQTYALVGECYVHGMMHGECRGLGELETITLV